MKDIVMENTKDDKDGLASGTQESVLTDMARPPPPPSSETPVVVSGGRRRGRRKIMKKVRLKDDESYLGAWMLTAINFYQTAH